MTDRHTEAGAEPQPPKKQLPELVVTFDGVPCANQEAAIKQFALQCLAASRTKPDYSDYILVHKDALPKLATCSPSLDALVQAARAYLNQSYALMDFHTRVMMDEHRKNLEAALSAISGEGR